MSKPSTAAAARPLIISGRLWRSVARQAGRSTRGRANPKRRERRARITKAYTNSPTASRYGTRMVSDGSRTRNATPMRNTMREATFAMATARAPSTPSTIQRRLKARGGSTSAKRMYTDRVSADGANSQTTSTNVTAAAIDMAIRSPRTRSASSRNRSGARAMSRTFRTSVPALTTIANQAMSVRPTVISP